jgi:hypothetical protein
LIDPVDVLGPIPFRNVVIARMDARADLTHVQQMPRGAQRRAAAFATLRATADESQRAARAALMPLLHSGAVRGVESLALPNALLIEATPENQQAVRDALAGVAHIADVSPSREFGLVSAPARQHVRMTPPAHWGVDAVHARDAWRQGARGGGVTIGFIDSGYDATHPALHGAYRGANADGTQTDAYNFIDFARGTHAANDQRKHGTEVASQAVSPDFGSAPDARAIAVAASYSGNLATHRAFQALQWMLAPTRQDGTDADPARGADVVNISWGTSDGSDQFLRESYDALRAAGIEIVTAVGNGGPEARVSAPASYPGFISVGAINKRGELADFSSRGPSPLPHGAREFVPLIVAPGSEVPSAVPGGGYVYSFGTSVAAPIVAGAVADLISAAPTATHDEIVQAITSTAHDIGAPGPDDASGYGLIDIGAAVAALRRIVASR